MVKKRMQKKEKPFDMILMDINMPIMDGFEAACKIVSLGVETPIVAITASTTLKDMEMCKECGINDHIAKPFSLKKLQEILLKYFEPNGSV